ncbi:hypothetical protein EV368DRAFT_84468 [Lentinula lateritia]|nr:hypothetical protein EV368DRAFT_84468 [Lentinula lateritia]
MAAAFVLFMPNEIQLEIFHAVHDAGDTVRPVSQVCRLWRELTVNTSTFWTGISVNISSIDQEVAVDNPYTMEFCRILEVFPWPATLLRRSGFQPIDISINLDSDLDTTTSSHDIVNVPWVTGYAVVLARFLAFHAVRFRHVEIVSDNLHPVCYLSQALFDMPMPLLEQWSVILDKPRLTVLPPTPAPSIFQRPVRIDRSIEPARTLYPKLASLSIHGVTYDWEQFIPRNLVTLDLGNLLFSYDEFKSLLVHSKFTLQSLTVSAMALNIPAQHVSSDDRITLPNLHFLAVGITFDLTASLLATQLDVPNLLCLEIHDITAQSERTWNTDHYLQRFYLHIIANWPLKQLTHLTLGSAHCPMDPANLLVLQQDFEAGRGPSCFPSVLTTLFFNCTGLKNLRLLEPDSTTLKSLNVAVNLQDKGPGILPSSSLDFLHIETQNYRELAQFLAQVKIYADLDSARIIARFIPTILLDIPPAWGAHLCTFLSRKASAEILNGEGYFEVESGRIFNLLDNLPH